MNIRSLCNPGKLCQMAIVLAVWPMAGIAQVPVDESGNPIGEYQQQSTTSDDADAPLASSAELESLVGSVALYPDDLLAIILPASTYPLQLVEASRFLEDLKKNPSLQPDDDWDDSVVALTNYPEVIDLLNADLDWTWRLGEAVVAQQADVIAAVEAFRDRAYAAGNLKSDDHQNVTHDDGVIEISPVNDETIYVPYYEPERVVVYQPRPVYYYHPRPYPVYYYPYPYGHSFNDGYFWGITTAFTIGWATDYLHVYHHSYRGHPYYGYSYNNNWWYRRPSINIHNSYYVNHRNSSHRNRSSYNRYQSGDRWHSNNSRRMNRSDQRVTRTRYRPRNDNHRARNSTSSGFAPSTSENDRRSGTRNRNAHRRSTRDNVQNASGNASVNNGQTNRQKRSTTRQQPAERAVKSNSRNDVKFRSRSRTTKASRNGQNHGSVSTRGRDHLQAPANTTSARNTPAPSIRFAPRDTERPSGASRGNSNNSRRTTEQRATSQRNITVARNSANDAKRSNSRRNTSTARTSAASRPSTTRSQPARRLQKSTAARQQTQRKSASKPQKSRSSNHSSGSNSKSKSESGSRSRSNSGNNNRRSRKT